MGLVIMQEPEGAWCQLEGDSADERERLGAAAARGERTCRRGVETIDRLRALAAAGAWPRRSSADRAG
jgi:hypothetical protein